MYRYDQYAALIVQNTHVRNITGNGVHIYEIS